jgi:hypothetical protein
MLQLVAPSVASRKLGLSRNRGFWKCILHSGRQQLHERWLLKETRTEKHNRRQARPNSKRTVRHKDVEYAQPVTHLVKHRSVWLRAANRAVASIQVHGLRRPFDSQQSLLLLVHLKLQRVSDHQLPSLF